MSDHLERVKAFLDLRHEVGQSGAIAATAALGMRREKLTDADLRALVAEVEELRAELRADAGPECPVCQRTDITLTKAGRMRHHGGDIWIGGRRQICKGVGELPKTAPQQPTQDGSDCPCGCPAAEGCYCGSLCPCDPCEYCDRNADWEALTGQPAQDGELLPERQAQLLAAIRRNGGDWSPGRAQDALIDAGFNVEPNRAHQIMKALAARGYLEQIRPRAYTYRLKQQPEPGGEAL